MALCNILAKRVKLKLGDMGGVGRAWLIAEREFKTYVATASFWIALVIGPISMAGALALAILAAPSAAPLKVTVEANQLRLAVVAASALKQAMVLDGHPSPTVVKAGAVATLSVQRSADGALNVTIKGPLPLSPLGRAFLAASVERDDALGDLGRPQMITLTPPPEAQTSPSSTGRLAIASIGRFSLVMMLWLTLTGSLGMLLQAVVRERSNRSLEILLAAARPWEIVFGKLVGIGGVSLLVLLAWLGASLGLACLTPSASNSMALVLQTVANPALLAYAVLIYVLAYLLFGLVTVAVGAAAGDVAAAQNLSRPMFAVLLAAFFAALAGVSGASDHLAWLVYVPPFTPFMLLLTKTPISVQAVSFIITVAAISCAGWCAVRGLTLASSGQRMKRRTLKHTQNASLKPAGWR